MDLPRFILLKSNANNKFLCYTKEKDTHSFLRFSYQAKNPQQEKKADDDDESDKIGFHHLKFEVEKAKSVEGLVHIRSCYNNKYWAREEQTEEKTITYAQTIKIPPGKKVTLKVVAQKAYCDVPFTCKVRDLMTDGNIREYTKNDGLYSGCNEFQFDSDIIEEDV